MAPFNITRTLHCICSDSFVIPDARSYRSSLVFHTCFLFIYNLILDNFRVPNGRLTAAVATAVAAVSGTADVR